MSTSIYDIVRQGGIGPLTVGQDLRELSKIISPPKGWIFPYEGPLDGVLDYGAMEIFVKSVADNVEIYLMKIHLFKSPRRNIRMRLKDSTIIELQRPPKRNLEISTIRSELTEKGTEFSTNSGAEISEGARPYFEINKKVRLYFSGQKELHLNYLEFGTYS